MSTIANLPDIVLSCIYINITAVFLLVGVLVLYNRAKRHDKTEKRIYTWMAILIILESFSYIFETAVNAKVIHVPILAATIESALLDININAFCLLWIVYVNYRMYHGFEYITRSGWKYLTPFAVLFFLNILGIFIPVFQYMGEDMQYHVTPLYTVQDLIRYAYLIIAALQLFRYKKQRNNVRFFTMAPFVMPSAIGAIVHDLTPYYYTTITLGMAAGLTLLYAQIANEQSFCDQDTGFYNRSYLEYLEELIEYGKYTLGSIVVFDIGDADQIRPFSKVLRSQLPDVCEPIRFRKNEIIVFTSVVQKAPLFMLAEDVRMALDEYNETSGKDPIEVKIGYQLIKKNEECKAFFGRVVKLLG